MDTLHDDLCTYIYDSISLIILKIRNASDKSYRQNENVYFVQQTF